MSEEMTLVSLKVPRWVLDVIRSEARRLELMTRSGRPLKGDPPGKEKPSISMYLQECARQILLSKLGRIDRL